MLLACLWGCHEPEHHAEEHGRFLVTSPMRQDTEIDNEYVAQVRAYQHIELRALERGYLEEIEVEEGQAVTAGQLLFRIVPVIYKAKLDADKAELSRAE
ncbi:MAG: biotin/lipoyl-binding protein, partial [Myxococcales bacterium]|nr:biotin/lipoyl-binding protein [Myxococcales bacterium]